MTPLIVILAGVAVCLIGFISVAHALTRDRRRIRWHQMGRLRKLLLQWAGAAFMLSALLLLDAAMGGHGPWHLPPAVSGWLVVGSSFTCAVGYAIHRRYLERSFRRWEGQAKPIRFVAAIAVLALCGLQGCSVLQGHDPAFVGSMDSIQRAVGPEYAAYVAADPKLAPDQKTRRNNTVAAWRSTIDEALNPGAVPNGPATPPASP